MNWETSNKCLVIAHRGDTTTAVENTLPAFESALRMGVDGIELDLQLTKDGRVIVFHDWDLMRLGHRHLKIGETSWQELRAVPLVNGATLPTLEELLDLAGGRTLLNLELKTLFHFRSDLEKRVLEILKKFPQKESLLISSFNPFALWRIKQMAPEFWRGYLFKNKPWLHQCLSPLVSPLSINAPFNHSHPALVAGTHKARRKFFVWTVNDESDMKRAITIGVDGIITDQPHRLLNLLKGSSSGRSE